MTFLNKLKLRDKLLLLVLLPTLALFFFAAALLREKLAVKQDMDRLETVIHLSTSVGNAVHEFQKERGRTSGFLSTQGKLFGSELEAQRKMTDEAATRLFEAIAATPLGDIDPGLRDRILGAEEVRSKLSSVRGEATALNLSPAASVKYYTEMIAGYLDAIRYSAGLSADAEMSGRVHAYAAYLVLKENAGIERATLSGVFGAGAFDSATLERFFRVVAAQSVMEGEFSVIAPSNHLALHNERMKSPSALETARFRGLARERQATGNFEVDPAVWFKTITEKIDLLKEVEDAQAADLISLASSRRSVAVRNTVLAGVFLAVSFLLTFLFAAAILRNVHLILEQLVERAQNLTGGALRQEPLSVDTRDEIGVLALNFNRMFDLLGLLAKQTEAVARGDLAADVLAEKIPGEIGESMAKMIENVKGLFESAALTMEKVVELCRRMETETGEMSRGIEEQAEKISAIMAATEEMNASIRSVSGSAQNASRLAGNALDNAQKGSSTVSETTRGLEEIKGASEDASERMTRLAGASASVGGFVEAIQQIAEQTNLLALNAAIEATRAGDMGRGFAVVADEVRKLAEKSEGSARDIGEIVAQIQEEMETSREATDKGADVAASGVRLSNELLTVFQKLHQVAIETSAAINGISEAMGEQAKASDEIVRSVETANSISQESRHKISRIVLEAQELKAAAQTLGEVLGRFRLKKGISREDAKKNIDIFVQAHLNWVKRVETMLAGGDKFAPGPHTGCPLGKWYFGPAMFEWADLPEFKMIDPPHDSLHQTLFAIHAAFEKGDRAEAERGLELLKGYSKEVVAGLRALESKVAV